MSILQILKITISAKLALLSLIGFSPTQQIVSATEAQGNELSFATDNSMDNQTPKVAQNENSPENASWYLVSYTTEKGATLTAQTFVDNPQLQLSNGQISGNATCNRFFGTYTLEGNNLSVQPSGATLMLCPNEFVAQEQRFLAALEQVTRYNISNAQLQLLDADGNILLTFDRTLSPTLASNPWQLVAYNNGQGGVVSVPIGTSITASFDPNGGLTGFAGCNHYLAEYTTTADTLVISSAVSTRKFCGQPEGVMTQESAYLQALKTATNYSIEGNTLTLRNRSGEIVTQFLTTEMSE